MPYIGRGIVSGNFTKLDSITTSATATYALTNGGAAFTPQSVNQMIVSLNGVIQAPTDAFTISGSNIVFDSALTSSDVIDFILVLGDVNDIGVPSDDSISAVKLKTSSVTNKKLANQNSEKGAYGSSSNPITYEVKVITKTAAHAYNGSGSSSGYEIDGVEAPVIKFNGSDTGKKYYYRFDQSDASNSGHPLRFYLQADKTTAYTTNVTTNGTPGSSGAYTQIQVDEYTPNILYYQCSSHAYMGNHINHLSNQINSSGTLFKMPTTDGSNGQGILTNGSGVLSFGNVGVPKVSSDPSPLGPSNIGDVFFNTTSEQLKVATTTAGGWAAEADSPHGHTQSASAGNANAFVASGIYGSPTGAPTLSFINDTIEFDGSAWSATGSGFNPGYGFASGTGTQTAALAYGGWGAPYQTATGEYNGSTWSSGGALSSGRYSNCGGGTQSDAFTAGGRGPSGSPFTSVEEYNGTSWSAGTAIPTAQRDYFGGGTGTSAGWISRETSGHFSYDGSTWSTLTSNPVNQVGGGAGNSGPQSDHVLIGTQSPSYSTNVQVWDGSAWSAYTNYPEVTGNGSVGMSSGTVGGIHNAGGAPSIPGYSNTTVEKTAPSVTAKVISIS